MHLQHLHMGTEFPVLKKKIFRELLSHRWNWTADTFNKAGNKEGNWPIFHLMTEQAIIPDKSECAWPILISPIRSDNLPYLQQTKFCMV